MKKKKYKKFVGKNKKIRFSLNDDAEQLPAKFYDETVKMPKNDASKDICFYELIFIYFKI
jgi:hypothetical protein